MRTPARRTLPLPRKCWKGWSIRTAAQRPRRRVPPSCWPARRCSLWVTLPGASWEVSKPTAKYLLAMKVMACRKAIPGYSGDETDIAFLLRKMAIKNAAEVEAFVDQYFPDTVLPAATFAVIERLL